MMKPKAVLFDLDGTLLPMDQERFTRGYFKLLAKKLIPHGYEPDSLVKAIWHGTAAMVKNDGSCTNEEAFWKDFAATYGEAAWKDKALFNEFYAVDFQQAKDICGYTADAAEDCIMVGNDAREDMVAGQLGMKTFLLTDCVINPEGLPVEQWSHGDFGALQAYLKEIFDLC